MLERNALGGLGSSWGSHRRGLSEGGGSVKLCANDRS